MKLTNPIGRDVSTGLEANFQPRACMCGSSGDGATAEANFNTGRGPNDSCANCGCHCNNVSTNQTQSGNSRIANSTNRTSSFW